MNKDKIKELLKEKGIAPKMAKEIGITEAYAYDLRKGMFKNMGSDILEKVAKYFNKPVGYFFDEEHLYKDDMTENGNHAVPEKETYKEIISRIFTMGTELNNANREALKVKDDVILLMSEKRKLEIKLEDAEKEIKRLKKKNIGS